MIKKNVQDALEKQLNMEFHSAYLYLGLSTIYQDKALEGIANWMHVQAQEEMAHAMHIYDYLMDVGEGVKLRVISEIAVNFDSVLDGFTLVLAHEQEVTASINNIVDLALQEKDFATNEFLNWYVREQVEEETTAKFYVDRLKLIGSDIPSLLQLDAELKTRVFVDPFSNSDTITNA